MEDEIVLQIRNLTKKFGSVVAVNNLTIDRINKGEFVTFLGPSGCGKTTLLRMIGGFYYATSGDIIMHGQRINDIPPENRKTSMVFQNYALFPHMTVYDNIAYGLKIRKLTHEEIDRRVREIIKIVQLEGMEKRKPNELSGGQQQRVALARCIVIEPEVILLDEPLSNLDATLRVLMREEIRRIQKSLNLTTIFVTHDQEEAMSMSDRIVVMKDGEIQQIGTPEEIYEKPSNTFVASFIGYINLIEGRVIGKKDRSLVIDTPIGKLTNKNVEILGISTGRKIISVIRPESIELKKQTSGINAENTISGKVKNYTYIGSIVRYTIEVKGLQNNMIVSVSNPHGKGVFKEGSVVTLILPKNFHCIQE